MASKITPQSLKVTSAILGDRMYRIMDFPREAALEFGPNALSKGVAYRIVTEMTSGLFPYRGLINKGTKWSPYTAPVGVYLKPRPTGGYWIRISYPHNKKERAMYALDQAKDWKVAALDREHPTEQFIDLHVTETTGDAFMPPIRYGDDYLNKAIKLAFRLKGAPFEAYGQRLEAMTVDRSRRTGGVNNKNNSKRGLLNNETMSPTKSVTYSDAGELELCLIVKDAPGSAYPMFPGEPDKALMVFPMGMPFKIVPEQLVEATDLVNEAIADSSDTPTMPGTEDDD